jgi:hypothetical protein
MKLIKYKIMNIEIRDYIAAEAMKAEIISWNSEMSKEHRVSLLEDMVKRFGSITINEAISKSAYEMADAMMEEKIKINFK